MLGKFNQRDFKDLFHILNWIGSRTGRNDDQKKKEPQERVQTLQNFLSLPIVTQTKTMISSLMNMFSMTSNFLTVWGFLETREKFNQQPDANEVIEEWNEQIEELGSRMDDVKDSLKVLTCRIEYIYPYKNRNASEECEELWEKERNGTTNGTNTDPIVKTRTMIPDVEYSIIPSVLGWWGF